MKIRIGTVEFSSKKAALAACSAILRGYAQLPAKLSADDQQFMVHVLDLHPERDEKVKVGVAEIYINHNTYGDRGFYLRRIDGSTTDWSFVKCFNHPTVESDVRRAFRTAIVEQVLAFRDRAYGVSNAIPCAVTGVLVARDQAHVDHKYPDTFSGLVQRFAIEVEKRSLADFKVRPTRDHSEQTEFEDTTLIARWQDFHQQHAKLQITSARANLSKGNRA